MSTCFPKYVMLCMAYCGFGWGAYVHASPPHNTPQRVALVIGHNKGSGDLKPLHYAQQDAQKMAALLREVGGYKKQHIHLLLSPTRKQLHAAMQAIKQQTTLMRGSGTFFFYYSGHAKRKTFQLGPETLAFKKIWAFSKSLPVKIRLMVIDSCFAGRFLKAKGPRRLSSIAWVPPTEQRNHGVAVLASSGANGRSYESSLIKGSLFTSSVLAGLRGAADKNNDQRVSLAELWQYVYHRTLTRSSDIHSTIQRPAHRIQLQGQGPLILSVLSRTNGQLLFPASLQGHVFVYQSGQLLQDVYKPANRSMRLGLQKGRYKLHIRHQQQLGIYTVDLTRQHTIRVSQIAWKPIATLEQSKGYTRSTTRLGVLLHYQPRNYLTAHGTGLSLSLDSGAWLRLNIGYSYGLATPLQLPYQTHTFHLQVGVGYGFIFRDLRIWLGAMLAPQMAIRTYETKEHWNMGFLAGGLGHFDFFVSPTLQLRIAVSGGVNAILFAGNEWLASSGFDVAFGILWNP
jgi:hypothetical protein